MTMATELEVAQQAARAAGDLLAERFGSAHQIRRKGPIDLVTEMDRRAEDLIAATLRAAFPAYGLIAEEGGGRPAAGQPHWLVDPLDGTTNYARGYPFFAVSIALVRDGEPHAGVVYNPLLQEMFAAERGRGATLNGQPIHVSGIVDVADGLLASGFPYDVWTNETDNSREWHRFLKRALSLRSDGAASLDLCHVAAGRLDGYWELDLEPWDMAAGALIVQEAGGAVTQTSGAPFSLSGRSVLATNGRLQAEILAILSQR